MNFIKFTRNRLNEHDKVTIIQFELLHFCFSFKLFLKGKPVPSRC